jgi:hypothetical protein
MATQHIFVGAFGPVYVSEAAPPLSIQPTKDTMIDSKSVTPLPEPAEPATTDDDYQAEWFTLGGDDEDDDGDAGPVEFVGQG